MSRWRDRAGVLSLAAFLVVDVLLVGLAISSTRSPVARAGAPVDSGAVVASSGSSTTKASTASPDVEVSPLAVGIVAVDGDTALRFHTGTCKSGGATLELSTNGGKTWAPRAAPYDTVMRVRVRSDGSAFVVGADQGTGCTPRIRQAGALDGDFGDGVAVGDAWYRDARAETSVGLPTGETGKPCGSDAVIDLAVVDTRAAVLCSGGQVRASGNGKKWNTVGSVKGALAVALGAKDVAYAVAPGADSCAGLAVVEVAKPSVTLGCAEVDLAEVDPGSVALAITSTSGWLVVGGDVYRADGKLEIWRKS
jgi:hypothetical protein